MILSLIIGLIYTAGLLSAGGLDSVSSFLSPASFCPVAACHSAAFFFFSFSPEIIRIQPTVIGTTGHRCQKSQSGMMSKLSSRIDPPTMISIVPIMMAASEVPLCCGCNGWFGKGWLLNGWLGNGLLPKVLFPNWLPLYVLSPGFWGGTV